VSRVARAALVAGIVAADQALKVLVGHALAVGSSMPLIPGVLALTHVHNPGVAFSLLQGVPTALPAALTAVLLGVLLGGARRLPPLGQVGLAVLCGGAVGNLVDRVRIGAVVDYLDLGVWPVFNLADVAVTAGTAAVLVALAVPSPARGER
jgi:signal peptidase II